MSAADDDVADRTDVLSAAGVERRSAFVDLTPLRESPAFARLWIGTAISAISAVSGAGMTLPRVFLTKRHVNENVFPFYEIITQMVT